MTNTIDQASCATCAKTQDSLATPLQRCGRCLSAYYCSTACQRNNLPSHKRSCKKPGYTAPPSMSSTGAMLDTLFGGSNLDRLTKKECYNQFINSYRLRVEDDYKFACYNHGLYADKDPRPEFERELGGSVLCGGEASYSDHYKDNAIPMKLRLLTEKAYGRRVQDGL
ncbi:MAG: hypothetical protein Q9218_005876 [Villophora microphyllina]